MLIKYIRYKTVCVTSAFLLHNKIYGFMYWETYRSYIDRFINASQWDPERLAFRAIVVLIAAIAELFNYPAIPGPVTMNEYIEIANSYSTPRSGQFINGILFSIVRYLNEEGIISKN